MTSNNYSALGLQLVGASGHPDRVRDIIAGAAERADVPELLAAVETLAIIVGDTLDQAEKAAR